METRNASTATETCGTTPATLEFRLLLAGEDGSAFRTLNEEWITRYFALEEKDREVLADPENLILRRGGHVILAYSEGDPVGCVALVPLGGEVYEVSKMAVSPQLRNLGIGRRMLEYAIEHARRIGARSLFLGSSTKLPNAVHLYESVGFRHVPADQVPPIPYKRTDVFMEMLL